MKKTKVYLTFDIETITSRFSRNLDFQTTVLLGALTIAHELKKRNLNAVFFISMSPKFEGVDIEEYYDNLRMLINILKNFENIELAPHIHAFGIPMKFSTSSDSFDNYSAEQCIELLEFAKSFFGQCGVDVKSFRAGGFKICDQYYDVLSKSGYIASSTLDKLEKPVIDLVNSVRNPNSPRLENSGVTEYPVTSVWIRSIKRKSVLINLSPDFLTLSSVKGAFSDLNYINMNFHSFSMYSNRLIRENHKGLVIKNIQYLLFEKIIGVIGSSLGLKMYKAETVFHTELLVWLDHFTSDQFYTLFMGRNVERNVEG